MHKNIGQRSRKGRSPRSGSVSIDKCPAVVEAAAQTFSLTAGVLHFYVADITYSQCEFLISVNKSTVMSFAIAEALAQFSSKLLIPLCFAVSVIQRMEIKGIRFT